jgi:hypothetical protein
MIPDLPESARQVSRVRPELNPEQVNAVVEQLDA